MPAPKAAGPLSIVADDAFPGDDITEDPPADSSELEPLTVVEDEEEPIEVSELREWKSALKQALLKMRLERRSVRMQLAVTDRLLWLANNGDKLLAARVGGILNPEGRMVDTAKSLTQELKQRRLKQLFQAQELDESIALHTAELKRVIKEEGA